MKLKKLIETTIREYLNEQQILNENFLLADKIYFKTGKLTDEDKEIILNITNRNNYTKLIADFCFYLRENDYNTKVIVKKLNELYNDAINYNKNVYPIIGYDVNKLTNIGEIILSLEYRREIIENLKKLPSIAIRNMKEDIRLERTRKDLSNYLDNFNYFISNYELLSNRDKETQIKILRKMFKANTTLKQLMRFVDDKSNFIGGVEFTINDIKELSKTEDFEIIYEKNNIMIVRVDSPQGIKAIGCNSLWCFTYGSGFDSAYRQWNEYSYNDMVYVIINFRQKSDTESFMHVLIKPLTDEDGKLIVYNDDNDDEYPLYNMSNENYFNPYSILNFLFGTDYKKIIKNYLNFEY